MTNSTYVERRRLRARLALLSFSTILCSGLAAPALAQTAPPPFRNVDANGVDLTRGDFLLSFEDGSIGSGKGKLSLMRQSGFAAASQWDNITFKRTRSGSSISIAIVLPGRIGATFTPVSGSSTAFTSNRADGSSLTLSTLGNGNYQYTYLDADGSSIIFSDPTEYDDSNLNNFCHSPFQTTCDMIPTEFTNPRGQTIDLSYDLYTYGSYPDFTYGWRIANVVNNFGYSIGFHYLSDSPSSDDFFVRTGARFLNGTTVAGSVSYAIPSYAVTNVTDMAGNVWQVTGTSIKRPGESAPSLSLSGSVVTRDGVATTYSRTVAGSTGTMTVTDALSRSTKIVSNLTISRPTSVTDADSHTTTYTYDSYGRLTRMTQPEGNYVNYLYDARGNVTETRIVAKSGSGIADIVSTASYPSTCANAFTCNQPTSTTDARGNTTDYTYNSTNGVVTSVTAPAPATAATRPQTRYSYVGSFLTGVSTCQTGTAPACVGTSDEVKTTIGYDGNNNVTSIAKGAGNGTLTATTAVTYTTLGDVTTVDGPLSGTADTTTFRYDAARRQVGAISADPDGAGTLKRRAQKTTYDSAGRPTVSEIGTVTGTSDTDWAAFASAQAVTTTYANNRKAKDVSSAGGTTYQVSQYSYDADGRLECTALRMNSATWGSLPTSACMLGTTGAFGPDRIVKATFDTVGRVTKTQSAYGTPDQADDATGTYSNNGAIATLTDANANTTTYEYDGFDRLSKTRYPSTTTGSGTSSTTDYEQLAYDANSNVTSRRLRDGNSIGYSYDALDRLVAKDLPGSELDVTYGYDSLSRPLSAATSAQTLSFTYDALGRNLTQVSPLGTVTAAFDLAGRRTQLTWPDAFYVTYDHLVTGETAAIRENGATSGVGVLATFAYDDLGRRIGVTRGNGTTTSYTPDPVSRLSSLTHDLAGTANDLTLGFSYTPASQIAGMTRSNDSYAWTGSANRNDASTINGLNQLTGVAATSVTHDARGNVTGIGATGYSYSSENLLVGSTLGVSLAYDPLDRLSRYTTPGAATDSLYDGTDLLTEVSAGNVAFRYVWGPNPDELLVTYVGANTAKRRFWSADERGSIVAGSDAAGTLIGAFGYDEYGVPGTSAARFGYTGQRWLAELGLNYYKARMYAPSLGRFLQTDPIGYGDGMNWYGYVGGDPVNGTDPSGLVCVGGRPTDIVVCGGSVIRGEAAIISLFSFSAPVFNLVQDADRGSEQSGEDTSPIIITAKKVIKPVVMPQNPEPKPESPAERQTLEKREQDKRCAYALGAQAIGGATAVVGAGAAVLALIPTPGSPFLAVAGTIARFGGGALALGATAYLNTYCRR